MPTKQELEQELAALRAQYGPEDDAKTMPDAMPSVMEMLARPFDPATIKKNPRGYHYVQIDEVYNRLDEVLGPNWTLAVQGAQLTPVDPAWKKYGSANPKAGFLATVTVRISSLLDGNIHTVRDGVGADFADDPDKAIKTALANAVKKAANGFGVARYLWKDEERAAIDEANEARQNTKALKQQVVAIYESEVGSLQGSPADKAEQLAKHFGVEVTDLASAETLNAIIEKGTA